MPPILGWAVPRTPSTPELGEAEPMGLFMNSASGAGDESVLSASVVEDLANGDWLIELIKAELRSFSRSRRAASNRRYVVDGGGPERTD